MKQKNRSWFIGICGALSMVLVLLFLLSYFKNVSVGEWIARENYLSESEWLKRIGLFIATMWGFYMLLHVVAGWLSYIPDIKKRKKREKCQQ